MSIRTMTTGITLTGTSGWRFSTDIIPATRIVGVSESKCVSYSDQISTVINSKKLPCALAPV